MPLMMPEPPKGGDGLPVAVDAVSVTGARAGTDVHAFALAPEQAEVFDGFGVGTVEPVRDPAVELGGFAGR